MTSPDWLLRAQRLAALAQTGLTYARDHFDRERYLEVRALAAEMLAAGAGEEPRRVAGLLAAEEGYATPKVDVRAAVFDGGRVLLVRERVDGGWTLPGGWADVGESPGVAAAREVREESGYEVRTTKLLAVWDKLRHDHPPDPFHAYKLVFRCELTGGAPATSHETTGVDFFAEDALPPLSLPRTTEAQLRRLFAHARDPGLPTDFD